MSGTLGPIVAVVFSCAPMVGFTLFMKGGIVDQFRRRAFKPQPLVELVCEMLAGDIGWSGSNFRPCHDTGIYVDGYSAGSASLRIDSADVPLSKADKFQLHRAVKAYGKRQNRKRADAAAIELSLKVQAMAQRVQEMSDKVVNIRGAA